MPDYNQPAEGAEDWHVPLNENFSDLGVEVMEEVAAWSDLPAAGETQQSSNGQWPVYRVEEDSVFVRVSDSAREIVGGLGSEAHPVPDVHSESVHAVDARFGGVPWHDVTSYGAVGDGSTDDSQAIINATNATNGPSVVYFPTGDYLIGSHIDPDQTAFIGPEDQSARLVAGDLGQHAIFENLSGPVNYGFYNLEMDGSQGWTQTSYHYSQKAIYAQLGENLRVENCYAHDFPATIFGTDSVYNAWYVNNEVVGAGTDGEDQGSNGIGIGFGLVGGAMPTYLINNTIEDTAEFAIIFEGIEFNETVFEWGFYALGNYIRDARVGIGVDGMSDGSVVSNNIIDATVGNMQRGIAVGKLDMDDPARNFLISDNTIQGGPANDGIVIGSGGQAPTARLGIVDANYTGDSDMTITNNAEYVIANGLGEIASGVGDTPSSGYHGWARGFTVRNTSDGTMWRLDYSDNWKQVSAGQPEDLSGVSGEFNGHAMVDDGSNVSTGPMECRWDDANSQWVASDGTTF